MTPHRAAELDLADELNARVAMLSELATRLAKRGERAAAEDARALADASATIRDTLKSPTASEFIAAAKERREHG